MHAFMDNITKYTDIREISTHDWNKYYKNIIVIEKNDEVHSFNCGVFFIDKKLVCF